MRSRDKGVCSDHSEQLRVFPWHVGTGCGHEIQICAWTSTLPLMWSTSLSVFIMKFCFRILETPPASWLLLAKNCHLQTTWQFAAVFVLANFVAWSPLKVQRNINNLYGNPTLPKSINMVMVRKTSLSLQVTTSELTFFLLLSLSRPKTVLTVVQFDYVMHR